MPRPLLLTTAAASTVRAAATQRAGGRLAYGSASVVANCTGRPERVALVVPASEGTWNSTDRIGVEASYDGHRDETADRPGLGRTLQLYTHSVLARPGTTGSRSTNVPAPGLTLRDGFRLSPDRREMVLTGSLVCSLPLSDGADPAVTEYTVVGFGIGPTTGPEDLQSGYAQLERATCDGQRHPYAVRIPNPYGELWNTSPKQVAAQVAVNAQRPSQFTTASVGHQQMPYLPR